MPRSKRWSHLSAACSILRDRPASRPPPALDENAQRTEGLQLRREAFSSEDSSIIESSVSKSVLVPREAFDKIAEIVHCVVCGDIGAAASVQLGKLSPALEFKCNSCSAIVFSQPGASVSSVDGTVHKFDGKKMCLVHDSLMNGGGYAGYCDTSIRLGVSGLAKSTYYKYVSFLLEEMNKLYAQKKPRA